MTMTSEENTAEEITVYTLSSKRLRTYTCTTFPYLCWR